MMYKTLIVQIENQIARVTINRPEALNAINKSVLEELIAVFLELGHNTQLRGVILTGAGEKAFVAGADIAQMKDFNPVQAGEFCRLGHNAMNAIQHHRNPVIAAVNGFALGGGLELALACDFIYAAKTAKMGLPEVNLGIFPGFGGTQRLSRVVGRNRAKELIFTANLLSADEAFAIGLVNKVCEPQNLIPTVEETLKKIGAKGPLAIQAAKRVINEGVDLPLKDGLETEAEEFPEVFSTQDRTIGLTAFLEKKKAVFIGE